jgi:hypothetical protein
VAYERVKTAYSFVNIVAVKLKLCCYVISKMVSFFLKTTKTLKKTRIKL